MHRRILTTIAATTVLVLLAFLIPLSVLVQTLAESRATNAATLRIQPLIPLVAADPETLALAVEQINGDGGDPVTVYLPGEKVIGADIPETEAVELAERGTTLTADGPLGREIAVPVFGLSNGTAVIRVVIPEDQLNAGVTRARLWLLAISGLLLVLAMAVGNVLARSFVRPVEALAETADHLAQGDLAARVTPAGPSETRSVAIALNRLADRINELLLAEREAVADLSHRLRTPVTALRLDADSLHNLEERDRLTADVAALSRMVDAVIAEARRPMREGVQAHCDAREVVSDRVRFWSALAEDEGRTFNARLTPEALPVRSTSVDLAAAVDALLGNVFAHTPEGTAFAITLHPRPEGGAMLIVSDSGPGWPDSVMVGQRGVSGAGSTGLGLDIASSTAHAGGGSLRIDRPSEGGARVVVELAAPTD